MGTVGPLDNKKTLIRLDVHNKHPDFNERVVWKVNVGSNKIASFKMHVYIGIYKHACVISCALIRGFNR